MSNMACYFRLRFTHHRRDDLRQVARFLSVAGGEWKLKAVKKVRNEPLYFLSAKAYVDESEVLVSTPWGILAHLLEAFPELRITGRYRDEFATGVMSGCWKESLRPRPWESGTRKKKTKRKSIRTVLIRSSTPLSPRAAQSRTRLEEFAAMVWAALIEVRKVVIAEPAPEGFSWGLWCRLKYEPSQRFLDKLLKHLRLASVPQDTEITDGSRTLRVWTDDPDSQAPSGCNERDVGVGRVTQGISVLVAWHKYLMAMNMDTISHWQHDYRAVCRNRRKSICSNNLRILFLAFSCHAVNHYRTCRYGDFRTYCDEKGANRESLGRTGEQD
jgi:hypothetical protein